MHLSDSHRFGKQVLELIGTKNKKTYLKPRSTRLEKMFLDKKSGCRIIQDKLPFLKSGTIQDINEWKGIASGLNFCPDKAEVIEATQSKSYCINAAKLCVLSLLTGIIDLHSENIAIKKFVNKGKVQYAPIPIDIENIFWDSASIIDTLLLQSHIAKNPGLCLIPQNDFIPYCSNLFLDTFINFSLDILKNLEIITKEIEQSFGDHPNRVYLRPTSIYYQMLKNKKNIKPALLESEKIQLANGDIPYFFYRRSEKKLLYFKSIDSIEESKIDGFENIISAATSSIEKLLENSEQKIINSIAYISYLYLKGNGSGEFFTQKKNLIETPFGEIEVI